ncbi:MAG: hypothetical protein ACXWN4_04830 [Candidatus Limnocylindrales bacterium]
MGSERHVPYHGISVEHARLLNTVEDPPVGAPAIYRQLVAWRTRLRAGHGSFEALLSRACGPSTVGRLGISDG